MIRRVEPNTLVELVFDSSSPYAKYNRTLAHVIQMLDDKRVMLMVTGDKPSKKIVPFAAVRLVQGTYKPATQVSGPEAQIQKIDKLASLRYDLRIKDLLGQLSEVGTQIWQTTHK